MKRKTAVILPILLLTMLVAGCFGKKNTNSSEEPGSSQVSPSSQPGTSTTSTNPSEPDSSEENPSEENPSSEQTSEEDTSEQESGQTSDTDPVSASETSSEGPSFTESYRLAYGVGEEGHWDWDQALVGFAATSEDPYVAAQIKFEVEVESTLDFKIRNETDGWFGASFAEGDYYSDAEPEPNIHLTAGTYHVFFKEYMVYGDEHDRFKIYVGKQGGEIDPPVPVKEFADLWKLAYGVDGESPTWAWDEALVGEELASEDTNVKNQLKFRLETALPLEFKIRTEGSELEEAVWLGGSYAEGAYHYDGEGDPNIAITAGNYDIYFKQYIDYDEHEYSIAIVKEIVDVEYTVTDLPDWWDDSNDTYAWAWGGAEDAAKYDVELSGSTATLTLSSDREGFLLVWVTLGQEWVGSADWTTNLEGQSRDFVIDGSTTTFPYEVEVEYHEYTVTDIPEAYRSGYDLLAYYWGSEKDSEFIPMTVEGSSAKANLPADLVDDATHKGFLVAVLPVGQVPDQTWSNVVVQTGDIHPVTGTYTYAWVNA